MPRTKDPLTTDQIEKRKAANVSKAAALKPSHEKRRADSMKLFIEGCEELRKQEKEFTLVNLRLVTAALRGKGISPSTVHRNLQLSSLWKAAIGKKKRRGPIDVSYVNLNREIKMEKEVGVRTIQRLEKWTRERLVHYLAVALRDLKVNKGVINELTDENRKLTAQIVNFRTSSTGRKKSKES